MRISIGVRQWQSKHIDDVVQGITDQHIKIIDQLGLQTAEKARLEHLAKKFRQFVQGMWDIFLGSKA